MVISSLVASVLTISGCSSQFQASQTRFYQLPWPNEDGGYSLQKVEIETLHSPLKFKGEVAEILIDPFMTEGGELASNGSGRYIYTSDGVSVPANYETLIGVTAYAHFERLFKLDQETGAAHYLSWPIKVAVQANIATRQNNSVMLNNAVYDGQYDAVLVTPYDRPELPIGFNAGVLAHEHFHRTYQKSVINSLRQTRSLTRKKSESLFFEVLDVILNRRGSSHFHSEGSWVHSEGGWASIEEFLQLNRLRGMEADDDVLQPLYNVFFVRGLNEGLADFWGWVYTGDSSFLKHSLSGKVATERDIAKSNRLGDSARFHSVEDWLTQIFKNRKSLELWSPGIYDVLIYKLGSDYARFLHDLTIETAGGQKADRAARIAVARALMSAIPEVVERIRYAVENQQYISPNVLVVPVVTKLSAIDKSICDVVKRYVNMERRNNGDGSSEIKSLEKCDDPIPEKITKEQLEDELRKAYPEFHVPDSHRLDLDYGLIAEDPKQVKP